MKSADICRHLAAKEQCVLNEDSQIELRDKAEKSQSVTTKTKDRSS